MSNIGAAVAVFTVAALLWYQMRAQEGFQNQESPNVAQINQDEPPADLNRATLSPATNVFPPAPHKPNNVPGVVSGLRDTPATRSQLGDINTLISYWLSAASQQASERPGSLTADQLQREVLLQARLVSVKTQLGTGLITDTGKQVSQEIAELRRENAGWQQPVPNMDAVYNFAARSSRTALLTPEQYREFRGLLGTAIAQLTDYPQPDPLQQLRLQQLQVVQQDLKTMDARRAQPQIRVGAARMFLQQILKFDQPLPTLYDLEPVRGTLIMTGVGADDLMSDLHAVHWKLATMNDARANISARNALGFLQGIQSGRIPASEFPRIRAEMGFLEQAANDLTSTSVVSGSGPRGLDAMLESYDPADLPKRARDLCKQVSEAFSCDAEALGCPPYGDMNMLSTYEAESVINTVCGRLRTSVPSVSPEQFNCPIKPV